jgi:hypothetical protein
MKFLEPDLELGLLDPATSPRSPLQADNSTNTSIVVDENQNRVHEIIGDTLELLSRHLRA